MIKLSDRLQRIADFIRTGETMADIGTDHGLLPIYLWEHGICPHVILSDIKNGPLEKAKANINANCPDHHFDIRFGSGVQTLDVGEVDDIVIAGMGGLLIVDILSADLDQSKSYKKLILQPRNAPEKMKEWLLKNGFVLVDETLVRESRYIWEIVLAVPTNQMEHLSQKESFDFSIKNIEILDPLEFELSPILFQKKDPLLVEFIKNKIRIEEKIVGDIISANALNNEEKLQGSQIRIGKLKKALNQALEMNQ